MLLILYTDGACRGNPGPMAIGASIQDETGKELATVSELFGDGTNNIAEYRAVLAGLEKAKSLGATEIEARIDSKLAVEQLNGRYKVKNERLKALHAQAIELLSNFQSTVMHVPREQNQRADELANLAYIVPNGQAV